MDAMTRQEQIDAVFELLAPTPEQRAEREHDLTETFGRIERETAFMRAHRALGSKGKGGVERYLAALRRVQNTHRELDPSIRPWFSLPEGIDREIARANALTNQSPSPIRNRTLVHRAAVRAAHDLLVWWGYEPATTRHGGWDKLAAILAGDRDLDMFDYLREQKNGPAPTVARVKQAEKRARGNADGANGSRAHGSHGMRWASWSSRLYSPVRQLPGCI